MKKLMIAAAAAMAGAASFGGLCDPEAAGPDSCSVYNIKFTFKTLAAKTACKDGAKWLVSDSAPGTAGSVWYRNSKADTEAKAAAGANPVEAIHYTNPSVGLVCDTWGGAIANAAKREVFWMDNATRKFEGIAWQCKSACFEGWFADCDLNNNGRLNYVLWEKKNSLPISYPVFQVKSGTAKADKTGFDGSVYTEYFSRDAQWDMEVLGRYGKKAQKVAAYWDLDNLLHSQEIVAAGFGTYDVKNLRTKSISGNAVGLIMPIDDGAANACGIKDKIFCALGFMCVEWMDWCCDGCYAGVELVPASGTWSLKYNAAATKKANADKATLASFVPAYMFYSHSTWADARAIDPLLHTDNYYWFDTATRKLFYIGTEGGAIAAVTNDTYLDAIADAACLVIDIAVDASYDSKNKVYIYGTDYETGEPKTYELEDNGTLKVDDVCPELIKPEE